MLAWKLYGDRLPFALGLCEIATLHRLVTTKRIASPIVQIATNGTFGALADRAALTSALSLMRMLTPFA